jgi:hypothetical protein
VRNRVEESHALILVIFPVSGLSAVMGDMGRLEDSSAPPELAPLTPISHMKSIVILRFFFIVSEIMESAIPTISLRTGNADRFPSFHLRFKSANFLGQDKIAKNQTK